MDGRGMCLVWSAADSQGQGERDACTLVNVLRLCVWNILPAVIDRRED